MYRIDATRAFSPKHIDTFEFFEGYLEGQNFAKCYGGVFGRFVEYSEKALVWPIRPHDAWRRAVLLSSKTRPEKDKRKGN